LDLARLEGKVGIVTGAGGYIGRAISLAFAREGAKVALCDRSREGMERVASEISSIGGEARIYEVDVAKAEEVEDVVSRIYSDFGGLDILVNNAGIARDNLILRMKEEEWDQVIAVNLKGAFNFTKAVSRYFLKQRWGRIINISSVVGITGNVGQANYAASKAGLIGLTKATARELGSRGITANAVAPGFIAGGLTEALSQELKERMLERIPLGRFGTAEDVANLVLFLASDEASYITGQVISIDGGMAM
jgi:3-oxoacyl-[acyl-carrier protein] reductase